MIGAGLSGKQTQIYAKKADQMAGGVFRGGAVTRYSRGPNPPTSGAPAMGPILLADARNPELRAALHAMRSDLELIDADSAAQVGAPLRGEVDFTCAY